MYVDDAEATPPLAASATLTDAGSSTVCASDALVEPWWFASPPKVATMPWLPLASALVAHCAVGALPPPASATDSHPAIGAPPSANATVPVGPMPVTVAVKVTDAPGAEGLADDATVVDDDAFAITSVPSALPT